LIYTATDNIGSRLVKIYSSEYKEAHDYQKKVFMDKALKYFGQIAPPSTETEQTTLILNLALRTGKYMNVAM